MSGGEERDIKRIRLQIKHWRSGLAVFSNIAFFPVVVTVEYLRVFMGADGDACTFVVVKLHGENSSPPSMPCTVRNG